MKTREEYLEEISDLGKQAKEARREAEYFELYEPDNHEDANKCYERERKCWEAQDELERELRQNSCRSCGKTEDDIQERYSFGITAGRLCVACCSKYRDNCGLDQAQGRVEDLDEFAYGGYSAIDGE